MSGTEERALYDHVIWRRPIAPGALLVEQCLTGAREHGHVDAGLRRILISRSFDVDAFGGRNRLRMFDDRGRQAIALESWDGGWQEHIRAEIAAAEPTPAPLDLAEVRGRCGESVPIDTMYAVFENDSFVLGPTVKTAAAVQRGQGEVLARLESPAGVQPSTRFAGLVDGAFHSLAALSVGQDAGSFAYLSFSIERVDLYGELPESCLAHVQLLGEFDLQAESLRCDVHIVDDSGRVLLRLQHVGLRRASTQSTESVTPTPTPTPGPPAEPHPVSAHAVALIPTPLPADTPVDPESRYLLLTRGGALSPLLMSLRRRLEDAGSTVHVSRLSTQLDKVPAQLARLRPDDSAILCVDPRVDQLRAIAQGLLRRDRPACRQLTVFSPHRMVAAFLQSLAQEGTGWPCRAILLDVDAPVGDPVHLAGALARELRSAPTTFTTSYSTGQRAVPTLTPVARSPVTLTADGFYWITGGGGGIGRALATDLVARGARHLLVTGRRAAAPDGLVSAVEAAGGTLLYAQADVTSGDALARAFAAATAAHGALAGVFHLAGVVENKLVWGQTREDAEALLAPKVAGTRVLLDAVRDAKPAFIALFSSYVSQFGRAGQSDYAAANAALDDIAWTRPERPIVALDWFPWSVGMAGSDAYQAAARSQGLIPLHPTSAFDAMFHVLGAGHRQIVMSALQAGRAPSLADEFQAVSWQRVERARPKQTASAAAAAPTGDVESFLRAELAGLLRVTPDAVNVNEPFPAMGLESLTAVNLIRKIEDRYDIALYPTLLFEITTVAELTRYLEQRLAE